MTGFEKSLRVYIRTADDADQFLSSIRLILAFHSRPAAGLCVAVRQEIL
jgi:hypothetical protein